MRVSYNTDYISSKHLFFLICSNHQLHKSKIFKKHSPMILSRKQHFYEWPLEQGICDSPMFYAFLLVWSVIFTQHFSVFFYGNQFLLLSLFLHDVQSSSVIREMMRTRNLRLNQWMLDRNVYQVVFTMTNLSLKNGYLARIGAAFENPKKLYDPVKNCLQNWWEVRR